ncbi:Nitrate reductase [NADH] 1 [Dichanthelium oligosanthes]|uniref:Nitrate reductase [NADH] 1 n=1 Tax=Dichanthelium oligosanthes TaxID=888268 RepID=A0A1E5UNQ6_9POAL|nr:Nitrate reductase [NADH] 1 [Dichanthelium oligosanthes]
MLAFMNGTMAYPPVPSHLVVSSHAWDEEDDDEQAYWRELYAFHLRHRDLEPAVHDLRDEGTEDAWVKRNPSLIRLTGKHPLNCEPPLARLMRHGFITPAPLHYVRNHGAVPRGADWATGPSRWRASSSAPRSSPWSSSSATSPPWRFP